jgi:tetratricopeptide (TPR) repeat protein
MGAQHGPNSAGNPTGGPGSGIGSVGNTTSVPSSTRNIPSTTDNNYPTKAVFLSGAVLFDDGTKPNIDIVVETVCNGSPRPQGHTDSKGRFSFQIGQNPDALDVQDASVARPGGTLGTTGMPGSGTQGTSNSTGIGRNGNAFGADPLMGCEMRARYPGYRSDSVELGSHHRLDDSNVGTIILHRLANVKGTTISATTAEAPKAAVKNYEKGVQLVQKSKLDDAEKRLQQAVGLYPKYAVAWFALGDIQRGEGQLDTAAASYKSAIAADPKYVSPYDRLAFLAVQSGNWKDAEGYSKQAIALNPVEVPSSYLYNAVAALNLKQTAEAEESASALLKLDIARRFPDAEALLSQALLVEGKYPEAATHIRAFLARYPDSKQAPELQQALAKIDPASAVAKK